VFGVIRGGTLRDLPLDARSIFCPKDPLIS
jgi:hypothetical protein